MKPSEQLDAPVENYYRDTSQRYQQDPEFHAFVDLLAHFAERHGYTPGEMKQAAFMAALRVEVRNSKWIRIARGEPT